MKKLSIPRKPLLITIDAAIFAAVYIFVLLLSFLANKNLAKEHFYISCVLTVCVSVFSMRFILGLYSTVWRYANSRSFLKLILSDMSAALIGLIVYGLIDFFTPFPTVSITFYVSYFAIALVTTLASRLIYQQIVNYMNLRTAGVENSETRISIAIIGAGQIGSFVATELMYKENSHYRPVCFVDVNPDKIGKTILGLKVYGESDDIIGKLKKIPVQEVIVAMQDLKSDTAKAVHDLYSPHFKVKLYDFPLKDESNDDNDKRVVREFKIEDLLFRNVIDVSLTDAYDYYKGKTVLVTGGGGSIGSEICRQIAKCSPHRLIILDIYENNAYDIEQHLRRKYGSSLDFTVEIASVRDRKRLDAIFDIYRPDIVFHAAAHKHVPLMEHSNCEVIKNNILGTYNTADMAEKYGAEKFVLISTDKAVNPTNIMGASKRMCEMIVQCRTDSKTSFAAVRFGNVLGSNGSVIPLFKKQIEHGGPITITDKRIIRYFMTIPEASQLVLQTGVMAEKGELFVLNMGKPVKILSLAENMIRLSGLTPYTDIDIVEVGLRPGEKLYEELLIKSETRTTTKSELIFIEKDAPLTRHDVDEKIAVLTEAVAAAEHEIASPKIKEAMMTVVPTYKEADAVNKDAVKSNEMQSIKNAAAADAGVLNDDGGIYAGELQERKKMIS